MFLFSKRKIRGEGELDPDRPMHNLKELIKLRKKWISPAYFYGSCTFDFLKNTQKLRKKQKRE